MIPEKEFIDKLDTETIYSFLNQYQDKYVHEIYRNLDNIPSGSKLSAHIESVLQSLLAVHQESVTDDQQFDTNVVKDDNKVAIVDTARSYTFSLPENFYMYLRSVSNVTSTYSYKNYGAADKIDILPNQLVSQNDVWKLVETPHNSLRILRYPAAVLSAGNKLTIIFDRYTELKGVRVIYYKQPTHFSLMTSTACELPMDAFDDIVSGAVDLYVQYAAGAEANKRRQDEQRRQQSKENNRKRNNESED